MNPYLMFGQNCTNVVNRTSSVLMDDLTHFLLVFTSRLGDGRSERSKFSTSWATFEREYHPKPCVLLPENPLFLTVCHFPGIQRSHNTCNRNIHKCQLHKTQTFRYSDSRHEKGGPSRIFKYNLDNHSLWGYLLRSHVYSK